MSAGSQATAAPRVQDTAAASAVAEGQGSATSADLAPSAAVAVPMAASRPCTRMPSTSLMSFIILSERQLFLMTRYLTEALDDIDPELHGEGFPMDHYAVSMMVTSGMSYRNFDHACNKTPIGYAEGDQKSRLINAYRKMQIKFGCCVYDQPKKKIKTRSSDPTECWTKWWSSMGLGPLLMGRGTATFYLS